MRILALALGYNHSQRRKLYNISAKTRQRGYQQSRGWKVHVLLKRILIYKKYSPDIKKKYCHYSSLSKYLCDDIKTKIVIIIIFHAMAIHVIVRNILWKSASIKHINIKHVLIRVNYKI